jgi:hypothetical protein
VSPPENGKDWDKWSDTLDRCIASVDRRIDNLNKWVEKIDRRQWQMMVMLMGVLVSVLLTLLRG